MNWNIDLIRYQPTLKLAIFLKCSIETDIKNNLWRFYESFYDATNYVHKLSVHCKAGKKSVSLSMLVKTQYSAVQIGRGLVPVKLKDAAFSKWCSVRNNQELTSCPLLEQPQ